MPGNKGIREASLRIKDNKGPRKAKIKSVTQFDTSA
jgi:hypothetical protein